MRTFTYSTHIERSPDEVFAFMMDFSTAPRWRSLVKRLEVVGGGPVQCGTQVVVTMDVMGKVKQTISEIWSYDPPRRVGFRNTESNITGQFEYALAPERDGTRITFTADVRAKGFMWLVLPLVLRTHRARYREQLDRLKAVVERS